MRDDAPAQQWIGFDAVEIDTVGRRLLVAGREVELEPKAFDVLLLFARHSGRAFTRDEILDAVWEHRHVTPGVLNRIITLLRQALGESAEQPRYIHTLHGVGYRFDARVQAAERSPAAAVPMPQAAVETAAATLQSGDAPAAAGAPPPQASVIERPPAPPTRAWPPRYAAAALVALALIAAIGIWLARSHAPAPTAATPTLIVLPLRAVGGGHDETALADGLSEELITRLARTEGLRVISSTSARLAQEQHLGPAQLAQRADTTHALEGSLREAGDALRIDLRLIETPSGRTLWAQDYERKLADVFAIQRDIARAVAAALALRLGVAAAASSASGDVDVALYREYLQLRGVLLNPAGTTGIPKRNAARTALRELIVRAPDYARAHGLLARFDVMWSAMDAARRTEAEREAARALQLDPDDSDAHYALAQLGCANFDWETCLAGYQHVLALDPTDITARSSHAYFLAGIGYLDAAMKEFDTARRSDPLFYPTISSRARVLDTLGRHEEAKVAFDFLAKEGHPSVYASWYNAAWRHDYAAALEIAKRMPEQEGFREAYLVITPALQDASLWPRALKAIEESEHRTGRYNFARLMAPGYDARAFLASIEPMLAGWRGNFALLAWQAEYPSLRATPAFQDYIRRTHMLDYWRAHGFPPQCKPDGDGARCD